MSNLLLLSFQSSNPSVVTVKTAKKKKKYIPPPTLLPPKKKIVIYLWDSCMEKKLSKIDINIREPGFYKLF